jgi:hypothetical protein
MDNNQLYFAISVPVFAVIMSMIVSILQMNSIGGRFTGLEARMTSLEGSMNARFDTLTGKVIEIDHRLTRVESILERR